MTKKTVYGTDDQEGIDFDKLRQVLRQYLWLFLLVFALTNLAAYLTLRWTKDVFEAAAELKMEIKYDPTALGLGQMQEDQSRNQLAGEIEQMKSKLFHSRVLDSLNLWVSYYSIGNVLEFEMLPGTPFHITHENIDPRYFDKPIYFDFTDDHHYTIQLKEKGEEYNGTLGEPLAFAGGTIVATLSPDYKADYDNEFFFVLNSRNRMLDFLQQSLKVEPVNFEANTIRVSFTDHNPYKVAEVVNKVVSVYLSYSNEQKNRANRQKIEWLNRELAQVELKMENFENYFEAFTLKNKSRDVESDLKKTIYLLNKVDSQRFELNKRILQLDELMDDISSNRMISSGQRSYLPQFVNQRMDELQNLMLEQSRLTLSYKDNTYVYQQKAQEVNALKKTVFNQMEDVRKNWVNAMAELNQKKQKLEKEFATLPDRTTQYVKNQRFYKLYEEFYLSMMQSKAEFEIAQAGSIPDFRILSSAVIPTYPISPKRLLIVGVGLVGGVILNFFLIGVLYLLANKVSGLKEIEQSTHIPVLGVIPHIRRSGHGPFYILENPRSVVSEAIRTLRTNLDFFASDKAQKVIVISSTVSGEGKSFLAMNLGGVLAMSKKRVILLDLDMRKVKINGHFGTTDPGIGVSTLLIHKSTLAQTISKTSMEGFDYIPSGPHPPNPSELLLSAEFTHLLQELKKDYDYIVIDTPPVGLVTDGIMAMKQADLSIYVVRANYSKREFLRNLDRICNINKLDNVAVVLNALPHSGKTYGYGYYQEDRSKNGSRLSKFFRT